MGIIDFFSAKKKSRYADSAENKTSVIDVKNSTTCLSSGVDFFNASATGYPVTETTAMRVAAVYACVDKICVISSLPKSIYEKKNGWNALVSDHDYWPMLNLEPSVGTWTAQSMWERAIQSFLLRGDGILRIIRRPISGKIVGIKPYLREQVTVKIGANGEIGYAFHEPYSSEIIFAMPQDVLHFPGFSFNGYRGLSVIQSAAKAGIGIALSADQYSSEFFANGQRPDFLLTTEGSLTSQQKADTKQSLEDQFRGIGNRHKPLILQGGLKMQPVSLSAEDSQLLETRQFEVINICTAFGVPPQLVGAKDSTSGWAGSSIEQLNIGFVKYTLTDHINRMEQELTRKLFSASAKYFVKFDTSSFLEGDRKTQAEYFSKALGGPGQQGWMSVQEVRRNTGLPPDQNDKFNSVIESG